MLAHVALNGSCLNDSGSSAGPAGGAANIYLYIACVLSYLNALTNGFSLVVFVLDKKNVIMGRLLLLLSLSETVLNIGFAVNLTVMLSVMADAGRQLFDSPLRPQIITCAFFLSFVIANAFIMVRNWCLVMIAGSRCEVVSNPFSTRRGQLFSHRRSQACYAVTLVLSLLVCAPRLFEFTWTICEFPAEDNSTGAVYSLTTATYHILDKNPSYSHYKTLLVFPLQTIAPIFLISGLSLVIIFILRRRRHLQQNSGGGGGGGGFGGGGGGAGGSGVAGGSGSRSQDAATKTVMILMFSFIICELPTFLFFILNQTIFSSMRGFNEIRMHTTFLANIMLSADSFTNFIIYSSTSNTFRETVRRMLHLPDNSRGRSNNYNYYNNHMHNNNYTMLSRDANAMRRAEAAAAAANAAAASAAAAAAAAAASTSGEDDSALAPLKWRHLSSD